VPLDGLYANGPVMTRCRELNWPFMIVLKDACLPSVWEEVHGLALRQPDNHHRQAWGDRHQHFWWVNDIRYEFGHGHHAAISPLRYTACAHTQQIAPCLLTAPRRPRTAPNPEIRTWLPSSPPSRPR
jgi:hypothetical protein